MADPRAPGTPPDLLAGFQDARPVLGNLSLNYLLACDSCTYEKVRQEAWEKAQDEASLRNEQLTPEQVSRIVSIPRSILMAQAERKRKAGRSVDDALFVAMLNDLQNRLDVLDRRLKERYETLRNKYGDDVVHAMASTYLSDDEMSGLETDEQKLRALAEKFLDKDGKIKEQYKDLEEAKYIRDWNEAQKVEMTLDKYKNKAYLTNEERREITEVARSSGLAHQEDMYLQSDSSDIKRTVEEAMDENRQLSAKYDTGASLFKFGA